MILAQEKAVGNVGQKLGRGADLLLEEVRDSLLHLDPPRPRGKRPSSCS